MKKRKSLSEMTEDEKNGFFATPIQAVWPLIPFLVDNYEFEWCTFAEPCAGAGDLIKHLAKFGHVCRFSCDINPKCNQMREIDAIPFFERKLTEWDDEYQDVMENCDLIITNPPFSSHHTKTLHRMIDVFSKAKPTWLLLPLGKAANVNFAPFMAYCHEVVTIGRIKWFEGTKDKESRDFAWFLFDQNREFTGTNFTPYRKELFQ